MPPTRKSASKQKRKSTKRTKRISKNTRGKEKRIDITDVLLIVIVLLVLYFVLVENTNNDSKRIADMNLGLDVNVGDTNIGVEGGVSLDKDSLYGNLGVNIDEDSAYLEGDIDFGDDHKYGAGAYLKVNEDKYGMNLGYNSERNKGYLNIGEIEGFSLGYGPAELKPKSNEVTLALFHADWCGFCKKFMPIWEETVALLNNTDTKNGKKIKCASVEESNKTIMKEYNVTGYPTIMVLRKDKKPVIFNEDRTAANLKKFVENNT